VTLRPPRSVANVSAATRRFDRRGLLARVAVVGSAVMVSGTDYILRPGTAYSSVCGGSPNCAGGWTAMCCTINHGVNTCPPGSFPGGWWKAADASLCGGDARYYVDCQAECTKCGCAPGAHYCAEGCWSCKPHCADHGTCDHRRVCHNVFRYGQCNRDQGCSGPVVCRAISCTPPWKWADCSRTTATDDFTVTQSAPCLPRWTAIQRRYTALGSQASVLGATVYGEIAARRARIQRYQHGRMYWSPRTGAHFLTAELLAAYLRLGQTGSHLGLPTTDSQRLADGSGSAARFEDGGVFERNGGSAHGVWGVIWRRWKSTGLTHGPLGYPTTDVEVDTAHAATYAHFQHGSIFKVGKANAAVLIGDIAAKYRDLGYQKSRLGYPTTSIRPTGDKMGHYAGFVNGSIYQGPQLSAHEVDGDIATKYEALKSEAGPLGYPISDRVTLTTDTDGIAYESTFQTGAIVEVPPGGAYGVWGPIYDAWMDHGGPGGELGFPTSDVLTIDSTHTQSMFEHGTATYDSSTGVVTIVLNP
jgi:uncharacterized protein with LGFP repeats